MSFFQVWSSSALHTKTKTSSLALIKYCQHSASENAKIWLRERGSVELFLLSESRGFFSLSLQNNFFQMKFCEVQISHLHLRSDDPNLANLQISLRSRLPKKRQKTQMGCIHFWQVSLFRMNFITSRKEPAKVCKLCKPPKRSHSL